MGAGLDSGGERADKRQSLILLKPKTSLKLAETPGNAVGVLKLALKLRRS